MNLHTTATARVARNTRLHEFELAGPDGYCPAQRSPAVGGSLLSGPAGGPVALGAASGVAS